MPRRRRAQPSRASQPPSPPSLSCQILEHLPPPAIACLGSTCRRLRDAAFGGPYGEALWRRLAVGVLGLGPAALHALGDRSRLDGRGLGGAASTPPPPTPASTTPPPPRFPPGAAPRAGAVAWAALVGCAHTARLGGLAWSPPATAALVGGGGGGGTTAPAPAPAAASFAAAAARSGHAAVVSPTTGRIIITGGVRRDGGTAGGLDVVVLDPVAAVARRTRPGGGGPPPLATALSPAPPPPGRFRHAAVPLDTRTCPGAAAALAAVGAPPTADAQAAGGDALLVFGGQGADGREHGGGGVLEVAWVSRGGGGGGGGGAASPPPIVRWASIVAGGVPPAPRYHHTADAFVCAQSGGAAVAVFGGDGAHVEGEAGGAGGRAPAPPLASSPSRAAHPPLVHILDLASLTWRTSRTLGAVVEEDAAAAGGEEGAGAPPGPGPPDRSSHARRPPTHPGPRSLHLSTVRACPVSGTPQLVITGGYGAGGLAPMAPWALDLATLRWQAAPRPPQPSAPPPPPPPQPPPSPARRQRAASWRAAPDWLVMYGGSPAAGGFLSDVWAMHLPSLAWTEVGGGSGGGGGGGGGGQAGTPPPLAGRPAGPRRVAGHTLAGGVAFGGCVPTLAGVVPVAKCDVMLLVGGGGSEGGGRAHCRRCRRLEGKGRRRGRRARRQQHSHRRPPPDHHPWRPA